MKKKQQYTTMKRTQNPINLPKKKKANELKWETFFGVGSNIPDTYTFSYSPTYQLTSKKKPCPQSYLLEPDATYFANKWTIPNKPPNDGADFKSAITSWIMGNKNGHEMKMPNVKKLEKKFGTQIFPDEDEEIQITPIEGKKH